MTTPILIIFAESPPLAAAPLSQFDALIFVFALNNPLEHISQLSLVDDFIQLRREQQDQPPILVVGNKSDLPFASTADHTIKERYHYYVQTSALRAGDLIDPVVLLCSRARRNSSGYIDKTVIRILVIGPKGAGKTSIISNFTTNSSRQALSALHASLPPSLLVPIHSAAAAPTASAEGEFVEIDFYGGKREDGAAFSGALLAAPTAVPAALAPPPPPPSGGSAAPSAVARLPLRGALHAKKDKAAAIQDEVDNTKAVMQSNIDRLVSRGERLDMLEEKSMSLGEQASVFTKQSASMKGKMPSMFYRRDEVAKKQVPTKLIAQSGAVAALSAQSQQVLDNEDDDQDIALDRIEAGVHTLHELASPIAGELRAQTAMLDDIPVSGEQLKEGRKLGPSRTKKYVEMKELEEAADGIKVDVGELHLAKASEMNTRASSSLPVLKLICCLPCMVVWKMFQAMKKAATSGIDEAFADLEQVFYTTAKSLCFFDSLFLLGYLFKLVVAVLASAFLVVFVLPGIFMLLIVKTATVETKSDKMIEREQVVRAESRFKGLFRFIRLSLRSMPMSFALYIWPLILVFVIDKRASTATTNALLALTFAFQIVVLLLGAKRTLVSVALRMEESKHAIAAKGGGGVDADGGGDEDDDDEETKKNKAILNYNVNFRVKKLGNLIAVVSLLLEIVQMISFPIMSRSTPPPAPPETPAANATSQSNSTIVTLMEDLQINVFPKLMLQVPPDQVIADHIYIFAIFVVFLMVLIFAVQFVYELNKYERMRRRGGDHAGFYFNSFLGSLVYGHGTLKNVHAKVCTAIEVTTDSLFLMIVNQLVLATQCNAAQSSSSQPCWDNTQSQRKAVLSLIAFNIYCPASAMVSPMFALSNDDKDVKFLKPYLQSVTVCKVIMVVLAIFLRDISTAEPIMTFVIALLLFTTTVYWMVAVNVNDIRYTQPCTIPFINAVKAVGYCAATWSALCALTLAHRKQTPSEEKAVLISFFGGIALIFIVGLLWFVYIVRPRVKEEVRALADALAEMKAEKEATVRKKKRVQEINRKFMELKSLDIVVHFVDGTKIAGVAIDTHTTCRALVGTMTQHFVDAALLTAQQVVLLYGDVVVAEDRHLFDVLEESEIEDLRTKTFLMKCI